MDPLTESERAALREKPAMLAVGVHDHAIPKDVTISGFRETFGDRPVVELENAGHFCQEDAPEILTALIQQFVQSS